MSFTGTSANKLTSHCMAGLTSFDIDITQVEIDILPVCPCVNQHVFCEQQLLSYNYVAPTTKILFYFDYTQVAQVD